MALRRGDDQADLLRERRLELGLTSAPRSLLPAGRLLLIGSSFGGVLLVLSVLLLFWLRLETAQLEQQVAQLQPIEQRVNSARQRLQVMGQRTKALTDDTARLASQLVSIRSGSAFLEQLRRVTPAGVQLLSVSVQPNQLVLTGLAEFEAGAGAFERINALALNLEALTAVPLEGVTVEKVNTDDTGLADFNMRVAINPTVPVSPEELQQLGADGLARRYQFLVERGIDL